jgi:hypothetical protein
MCCFAAEAAEHCKEDRMKLLSIGNSFSEDTMEHLANIARSLGIPDFKLANLFIGGCSLNRHYENLVKDNADYEYCENTGEGWQKTKGFSIAAAIKSDDWDVISLQHGTGDKSRYTSPESYENLAKLTDRVRSMNPSAKIAFNMAWVAEPESSHHEISSYGGDQILMYEKLTALTQKYVAPLVDVVVPTGTAVQNARPHIPKKLTRDNFHLSYDLGRYIAGLTFLKLLCDIDLNAITQCPEGITDNELQIAKKAVLAAVKTPYATSDL